MVTRHHTNTTLDAEFENYGYCCCNDDAVLKAFSDIPRDEFPKSATKEEFIQSFLKYSQESQFSLEANNSETGPESNPNESQLNIYEYQHHPDCLPYLLECNLEPIYLEQMNPDSEESLPKSYELHPHPHYGTEYQDDYTMISVQIGSDGRMRIANDARIGRKSCLDRDCEVKSTDNKKHNPDQAIYRNLQTVANMVELKPKGKHTNQKASLLRTRQHSPDRSFYNRNVISSSNNMGYFMPSKPTDVLKNNSKIKDTYKRSPIEQIHESIHSKQTKSATQSRHSGGIQMRSRVISQQVIIEKSSCSILSTRPPDDSKSICLVGDSDDEEDVFRPKYKNTSSASSCTSTETNMERSTSRVSFKLDTDDRCPPCPPCVKEQPVVTEIKPEPAPVTPVPKQTVAIEPEPPKTCEPVKQEPVKQEPVKQEPVKPEPVKQEPVMKEPVKPEPVTQEPVKQEAVQTESIEMADEFDPRNTNAQYSAKKPGCCKSKKVKKRSSILSAEVFKPVETPPAPIEPPPVEAPPVEAPAKEAPPIEPPPKVHISPVEPPKPDKPCVRDSIKREPNQVRYAQTVISIFDNYTIYEVMKSTSLKPKTLSKATEGVFVVKS